MEKDRVMVELQEGDVIPNFTQEQLRDQHKRNQLALRKHKAVIGEKLKRNDPCHCGSGKKFKKFDL